METAKLVHLASFDTAMEANMAKNYLESRDIICILNGEHLNSVYPLHTHAFGGVKIMVPEDMAAEALLVLNEYRPTDLSFTICPNCSSTNIRVKNSIKDYLIATLAIISMVAIGSTKRKVPHICNDCGAIWYDY